MKPRTSAVIPPLLALAMGACVTDAPTAAVEPAAAAAKAPSLSMQGEPLAALQSAVSDAIDRVLPSLGDAADHAPLHAALAGAERALAADDARALAAALRAARAALAAEREALGPDAAVGPDLDALLLVLDGLGNAVPAALAGPSVTEAP